jgi:ribonuclease BN (tRNA processing enzyme)
MDEANLAGEQDVSSAGRLVTVGTGTCVPSLHRGGPCTLLEVQGFRCVVDLGLGSLHGLLRVGVRHVQVDAVLFTHHHPDHLAEVLSFLFAANYDPLPRQRPLRLAGAPGTMEALTQLAESQQGWLAAKRYPLEMTSLTIGEEFVLGPFQVRTSRVAHIETSIGYRFERGGRATVISGDTGPSASLVELASGADLLLAEASLAPGDSGDTHLTPHQAGTLAREAGVRRLVLHHLYPAVEETDPAGTAAAAFGGPVTVAEDGMEWEL